MNSQFRKFIRHAALAAKEHRDNEILGKAHIGRQIQPSGPASSTSSAPPAAAGTQQPRQALLETNTPPEEQDQKFLGQNAETPVIPPAPAQQQAALHEHLSQEGVPEELSIKMHNIVAQHPDRETKEKLNTAIHQAIEHKKKGNIMPEGLTKIVEEAVSAHEAGAQKEEVHSLISELTRSEIDKMEVLKNNYRRTHPGAPVPERRERIEGGAPDVTMPMPSRIEQDILNTKIKGIDVGEDLTKTNVTYPLIYSAGKVHVYANIRYDPSEHRLVYKVIEPQLTPEEIKMLQKIETTLVEELEVDFAALKRQTAENYLFQKVDSVIEYYGMRMTPRTREMVDYYIRRDFIGLSQVEPMFQDPNIEDISCDGTDIPIYVYHRDPRFGSLRTTVSFRDENVLNSFVMKLAQRCGRSISVADPLLDGALPDGSRVQATFGTGISMKGSNFTIRKFTLDPLTFVDLVKYGTISAEMTAFMWMAMEHGKSVLIAGPTACGKTTMLNSLSLFIRPELKIVSIEDTPELRLPHENWISQVARIGFGPEGVSGKKLGEISLFDLLKASLRQRPDEIIVGEVRGQEAYVLFQQIATGHPGMSTIHAESMEAVINRLTTPPIELPASLIQHLDILLVMTRPRMHGKYIRRVKEVVEVTGFDPKADRPFLNTPYIWTPSTDKFEYTGKSGILRGIMETLGTTPEGIFTEIDRRVKVIEWLVSSNIRDFKNVSKVVSEYYQSPQTVLERITAV